jgi:hypothetical protein
MTTTNKQYIVYYTVAQTGGFKPVYVYGFYGSLSSAQDAAQEADNNQNDDVWIVKLEQHRN